MVKAMPQQVVSHQPITLDAHVPSYASPCGYSWLTKWHQESVVIIFDFSKSIIPPMLHTHFFICHKAQ